MSFYFFFTMTGEEVMSHHGPWAPSLDVLILTSGPKSCPYGF